MIMSAYIKQDEDLLDTVRIPRILERRGLRSVQDPDHPASPGARARARLAELSAKYR